MVGSRLSRRESVKVPARRLRTGGTQGVADQLYALPLELEGTDRVAAATEVVRLALEQAARHVSGHARVSHRIAGLIAKSDQEKDRAAALRIGCLVLFNALAFQERLAAVSPEVPTISEARGRGAAGLRGAWRDICDNIDYVPVFELAIDILDALDDGPVEVRAGALDALVWAANLTRSVERHDLSGRLFHTLLTDAKFSGAYYTSVAAATLLARLVFHEWPPGVDWSDHEYPASLNVADLACGTGTLLMAVASETELLHKQAGGSRAAELHKAMVEQALHGYDVQLSAVHFAATSLAMLNPDIQFDRMNLYVMELGVEGSSVALGSLDFLGTDEAAVQHALSPDEMGIAAREPEKVYGDGRRGSKDGMIATLPDLDLAIMNPPFTRSVGGNLLFGSLPAADRRKLQSELSRRLKSMQASATARAWRGIRGGSLAPATPRRWSPGARAAGHGMHRPFVEADPRADRERLHARHGRYVARPAALELFGQHRSLGGAANRHAPPRQRLRVRAAYDLRQSLAKPRRNFRRAPFGGGGHWVSCGETRRFWHCAAGS